MHLVIGIGGTGGESEKRLKYRFQLYRKKDIAQYIYIDTLKFENVNKVDKMKKILTNLDKIRIEEKEYINYRGEDFIKEAYRIAKDPDKYENGRYSWFQAGKFNELKSSDLIYQFTVGAGQYRQIGRAAIFKNINDIWESLETFIRNAPSGEPFYVYICCSLVGGTGSGGLMDVGIILRHLATIHEKPIQIFLFLALEGAFADLKGKDEFKHTPERAYAMIRELHRLQHAHDQDRPLTFEYDGVHRAVVEKHLFDGVFLIDIPFVKMGEDEKKIGKEIRELHLYPVIADVIEIFTEENAGKRLEENVVNLNGVIRRIQNHEDVSEEDYEKLKFLGARESEFDSLRSFEPYFSTISSHRLLFPKRLYIRKFVNQMALRLLNEIFPYDKDRNIIRDDYDEYGKIIDKNRREINSDNEKKALEVLKVELIRIIPRLITSFSPEELILQEPPDKNRKETFMKTLFSTLMEVIKPKDEDTKESLIKRTLVKSCKSFCSGKKAEKTSLFNQIEKIKEKDYGKDPDNKKEGELFDILEYYKAKIINDFDIQLKEYIKKQLDTEIPEHFRGRFGPLLAYLEAMENKYLKRMLELVDERKENIKNDYQRADEFAQEIKDEVNKAESSRDLRRKELAYLEAEESAYQHRRRLIVNRYMIEIIGKYIGIVRYWKRQCELWATKIVTNIDSLYVDFNKEIEAVKYELMQLAQSPLISIGLPELSSESIEQPSTSMHGFEDYIYRIVDPEDTINSWLKSTEWFVDVYKEAEEEVPVLSLQLLSGGEKVKISPEGNFEENLKKILFRNAEEVCQGKIGALSIFDYLVGYLQKEKNRAPDDIAKNIASKLRNSPSLLKFNPENVITDHYLFYHSKAQGLQTHLHQS